MTWFLLNIPLAALFFLAWTLIPLWLVFRRPDTPAVGRRAAGLADTGTDSARLPRQRSRGTATAPTRLPEPSGPPLRRRAQRGMS
jgi:hypothetical protein